METSVVCVGEQRDVFQGCCGGEDGSVNAQEKSPEYAGDIGWVGGAGAYKGYKGGKGQKGGGNKGGKGQKGGGNKGGKGGKFEGSCDFCGVYGHREADC